MNDMTNVEVDQSGKIEDLSVDTVLAFSDGSNRAIRIPVSVKHAGLEFLRQRHVSSKVRFLRMLAAGFYLLLKDDLKRIAHIVIDVEFAGREQDLRGMLLILIWQRFPLFSKDQLTFRRIGKKSPAHHLAWRVYRGERRADRVIAKEEFIGALK